MPSKLLTIRGEVFEGCNPVVVARIPTADGTNLVRDDLNGSSGQEIEYSIYDLDGDTPGTAIHTGTLNKTAVIFDTLQTDGYWDSEDEFGYNFRHMVTSSQLAGDGHRSRIEYGASTSSFGAAKWVAEIDIVGRKDATQ
jgi:hypothetical protein